jgi:hypothetical protein
MSAKTRRKGLTTPSPIFVLRTAKQFEVWLRPTNGTRRRVGRIDIDFESDARCHGQDLLRDLIDGALRQFEREKLLKTGMQRGSRRS